MWPSHKTASTAKKQAATSAGTSGAFLFKVTDCKSLFFSVCFFFKKTEQNGGKIRYLKKGNVTGELHGEKKAELCPPRPARRPQSAGWEAMGGGGERGQVHGPCPLVLGRTPICSPPPHPPTPELLVLDSEGDEECGKYLKAAAAGPGRLLGPRRSRARVETPPPPWPGSGPRAPAGRAGQSGRRPWL